jgi:hypothetical protein
MTDAGRAPSHARSMVDAGPGDELRGMAYMEGRSLVCAC